MGFEFVVDELGPDGVGLPDGVEVALGFGEGYVLKLDAVEIDEGGDAQVGGAMHKYRSIGESVHDAAKCPEIL